MPHGCPLNLTPTPHLRNPTDIVKKFLNSKMMQFMFKLCRVKKRGHIVAPTSEEHPTRQAENGEKGQKNGCVENGQEGQKNGCVENREEGQKNGHIVAPKSVANRVRLEAENGEDGKKNDHALTPKTMENAPRPEAENGEEGQKNGHALTPKSVETPPTPDAENCDDKRPTYSESEPSNGTTLNAIVSTPTENIEGSQVNKNQGTVEAEVSAQSAGTPLNPEEFLGSKLTSVYLGRTDETQPVRRYTVKAFHLELPSPPPIEDSFEPSGKMSIRDLVTLTLNDPKFKKQLNEMTVSAPLDPNDQCDDPCSSQG